MIIRKTLLPIIKKKLPLVIAIFIICFLGIAFGSGFISFAEDIKKESLEYVDKYSIPDITIVCKENFTDKDVEGISIPGVTINYRSSTISPFKYNNKSLTTKTFTYTDDSFSKRYIVDEKERSTEFANIAFDFAFANNNSIKTGDLIEINNVKYYVQAIVSNPESIYPFDNIYLPQDKYEFGYTYIRKGETDIFATNNEVIIQRNDPSLSLEEITKNVKSQLEQRDIHSSTHIFKENHPAYTYLLSLLKDIKTVALIVPIIFVVLIFILVFLFLFQLTKSLTRDIGIMLAVGIDYKSVLLLLTSFSLSISLVASLFGLICGHFISSFIFNTYKVVTSIPYGTGGLVPVVGIICTLSLVAITCLVSLIMYFIFKKITPKDAINEKKSDYKPISNTVANLTKNVSPVTKVALSSIIKNYSRTIISIFAVISSFAISYTSLNLYKSEGAIITQMNDLNNFSAELYVKDSTQLDKALNFVQQEKDKNLLTNYELVENTNIQINGSSTYFPVSGIANSSSHKITNQKNEIIKFDQENTIVLDITYANKLNVKIGEKVKINDYEELITVQDIAIISAHKRAYMPYKTLNKIVTKDKSFHMPSITINSDKVSTIKDDLALQKDVSQITYLINTQQHINSITNGAKLIMLLMVILVVISLLIAFISLVIAVQCSYLEQKRKFSIMQALGLELKNVSYVLFVQNVIYIALGLIIGIPLGNFFAKLMIKICSPERITLIYFNSIITYLIVIGFIILIMLLCHIISIILIKNTNIAENTKSRE